MGDIVDTAIAAGSFKTLVKAVEAAGLVETLKGKGPFTVFAPTDDAFAKLPKGAVEGLLKDIPKLKAVLTYHVVSGKIMAADIRTAHSQTPKPKLPTKAKTVQGQEITIDFSHARGVVGTGIKVNGANVIKADIQCTNGIIHVMDSVIMPK